MHPEIETPITRRDFLRKGRNWALLTGVGLAGRTYPIALQLSGHSHGGQVRLPFYGPLITPPLAKKYVKGLFAIGDQGFHLHVSRGIGTQGLPVRFFCRPDLSVLTLEQPST